MPRKPRPVAFRHDRGGAGDGGSSASRSLTRSGWREPTPITDPEVASTDYREMLDRARPDVVYVETLPGHLLPIVLDCIERDIHTSVEKSPGMDSGETAQMLTAARRSSAKVIVSFNRRYFPQVLAVKQLVLGAPVAQCIARPRTTNPFGIGRPSRVQPSRHRSSATPSTSWTCSAGSPVTLWSRRPTWRRSMPSAGRADRARTGTTPSSRLRTGAAA